jgi:pimeloyl-ACP methyl ester carboxylesterase
MLHGFTASGVHYYGVLRRLRRHVRSLLAPDAPAHGFSDMPRPMSPVAVEGGLLEALDQLIEEPSIIYGNSMGGLAAVRFALRRPERVRALILCSPMGAPMDEPELARFLERFEVSDHARALTFIDRVFQMDGPMRHLLAWGVRKRFCDPEMRELLGAIRPDQLLGPDEVRALTMPLLFVWGRAERVMPPEHRDFFLKHLPPGSRIEQPPRFGHGPYLEYPEAVARQIMAFVRSLPEAGERAA